MRKIYKDTELKQSIIKAIHMLCDPTKNTLGPKGSNVLISSSEASPFITNDGVTIARNIESDEPVYDAILEIAKESSLKTNELVGDGTTTTLVLLEKMIEKGFEEIEKGYNPLLLKEEMENSLLKIKEFLWKLKENATSQNYLEIAKSSANDEDLGSLAWEVYQKMQDKNAIKIMEGTQEQTTFEIYSGYSIDYSFHQELELKDVSILLVEGEIESLEEISEIINPIIKERKNLLLVADSILEEVKQECTYYNMEQENKIICIDIPEYGERKLELLKDLAEFTKAKIWNKNKKEVLTNENLGKSKMIHIHKEFLILSGNASKEYLKKLQDQKNTAESSFEKEYLEERYAKLTTGLAIVKIGGLSKTIIREKKMRFEDAICALSVTKEGIVLGGGIPLLKLAKEIKTENIGEEVVISAFVSPAIQILENAGLNSKEIIEKIQKENFKVLYNVRTNCYDDILNTKIKDPIKVVWMSIQNAVSIASIMLTTSHIIINERKIEKNQIEF